MVEAAPSFSEVDAYERFMGRWSRAAAKSFLRWLAPPTDARWLDVGCGTGIFSQTALAASAPAALVGIDRTPAQVEHASRDGGDGRARFEVADAQALPFGDGTFDVVVSGLVLNFVPDPDRAVMEMRRAVRPGGMSPPTCGISSRSFPRAGRCAGRCALWQSTLRRAGRRRFGPARSCGCSSKPVSRTW